MANRGGDATMKTFRRVQRMSRKRRHFKAREENDDKLKRGINYITGFLIQSKPHTDLYNEN